MSNSTPLSLGSQARPLALSPEAGASSAGEVFTLAQAVPAASLGAFNFNRGYLGIPELGVQVKVGSTSNGYDAVQTSTGTYKIPDTATSRGELKNWVMQQIRTGGISGTYSLDGSANQGITINASDAVISTPGSISGSFTASAPV